MTTNNNNIENNPKHLKKAAQEALKAAKMLERQRMAMGSRYVQGPNRSWVLTGASVITKEK